MAETKKLKLKIDGMHCSSCAMLIDGDLEDLQGVVSAKTSYHKQECEVDLDLKKVKTSEIIETIRKTGYQAEIAQ